MAKLQNKTLSSRRTGYATCCEYRKYIRLVSPVIVTSNNSRFLIHAIILKGNFFAAYESYTSSVPLQLTYIRVTIHFFQARFTRVRLFRTALALCGKANPKKKQAMR